MSYSRYHIQLLELKVCTIDKLFMAFSFLPLKTQFRQFRDRFVLVSEIFERLNAEEVKNHKSYLNRKY